MTNTKYYDGTKLLSLMDINGDKPEIYICTTNRSGGKTTWFNRYLVKRFINHGEKFMLLYRYKYQLDGCADRFFKSIKELFFPNYEMKSAPMGKNMYHELYLNGMSCGYAVSVNSAYKLKDYSHFFSDTTRMMFDEFQSAGGEYCSDEVGKFRSLHTSVARGQGAQSKYVPVLLVSNNISTQNPYYTAMGIGERLRPESNFIRGEGWVLEQGWIESAAKAQQESAFNRAFGADNMNKYLTTKSYLDDNLAFIEQPSGFNRYVGTIKFEGRDYALRLYPELSILYCDDKIDESFPARFALSPDNHNVSYNMLNAHRNLQLTIKSYYDAGQCRFKNLACKNAVLSAIKY